MWRASLSCLSGTEIRDELVCFATRMLRTSHRSLTLMSVALLASFLAHGNARAQEPLHPKIPQVIEQLASSVFAEIDKRSRASRKPWTIMVVGFPEQAQQ